MKDIFIIGGPYLKREEWYMINRPTMNFNVKKINVKPEVKDPADELMSWLDVRTEELMRMKMHGQDLMFHDVCPSMTSMEYYRRQEVGWNEQIRTFHDVKEKVLSLKKQHMEGHKKVLAKRKKLGDEVATLSRRRGRQVSAIARDEEVLTNLQKQIQYLKDEKVLRNADFEFIRRYMPILKESVIWRYPVGGGKVSALIDENTGKSHTIHRLLDDKERLLCKITQLQREKKEWTPAPKQSLAKDAIDLLERHDFGPPTAQHRGNTHTMTSENGDPTYKVSIAFTRR